MVYIVYHLSRFQTNSAAVIAYLGTKSRFVTNDNKLRVVGVPCSFYILHELVKSEIVGLELLRMMVLTCKVLTETSNGCHIFFWFYAKPDSIVILHFELKKDFSTVLKAQLSVPYQHTCMGISLQKALYSGHIHAICAILPTNFL